MAVEGQPPFSQFRGFLKQFDLDRSSKAERVLFQQLFPRFFEARTIDPAVRKQNEKTIAPYPYFGIREDLKQPRRFAGYPNLPRGRYHTVCRNREGDDFGTLANELRAYRAPGATGPVDVLDNGVLDNGVLDNGVLDNSVLDHSDPRDKSPIGPPGTLTAIIHYPERIPAAADLLRKIQKDGKKVHRLFALVLPYRVLEVEIARVIDLRLPLVRKWFFEEFSRGSTDDSILWMRNVARSAPKEAQEQMKLSEVTMVSRFQRKQGEAPVPKDFAAMLPTLLNPELGGGIPAGGGSTLQAIGTWMREHKVGGLIYPSARCDVFADWDHGAMRDFGGWNFVDYRKDEDQANVEYVSMIESPWAWVGLPRGVKLRIEEVGRRAGSMRLTGMEEYSRREYANHLKAVERLRQEEEHATGKLPLFDADRRPTPAGARRLGRASIEWLTLLVVERRPEDGERERLMFSGIAAAAEQPGAVGRMDEIERELQQTGDTARAVTSSMDLADWLAEIWERDKMERQAAILILANRLHLLRFFTLGAIRAQQHGIRVKGNAKLVEALISDLDCESCGLSAEDCARISALVEGGLCLCGNLADWRAAEAKTKIAQWDEKWDENWASLNAAPLF